MELAEIGTRIELDDLYTAYAACLDTDALEGWPEFFTEDCRYRVTSAENYDSGLPIGLIYATSQNMLRDRINALRQANIYEPQRYRHLICGLAITGRDADGLDVTASFLVVRTMQDGDMTVFAVGRYIDRIVRGPAGWLFSRKEVILDSRRIDTLLAIPL